MSVGRPSPSRWQRSSSLARDVGARLLLRCTLALQLKFRPTADDTMPGPWRAPRALRLVVVHRSRTESTL
jgi:hypothetical protein